MGNILLVDDNRSFLESMEVMLESLGHGCDKALNLGDAWRKIQNNPYELVFLDLTLPDGSGMDLIPSIVGMECGPALLVLTGNNDTEAVDTALNAGAWDYLLKPIRLEQLETLVERTIRTFHAQSQAVCRTDFDRCRIVGDSPQVRKCLEQVAVAAKSDGNVLITGETGTGKELFAKAVHRNSARKNGPFIVMDCTNLPPTLAESLLFGHEKGSFTGAQESREGLFKQADGGTIFLDEIGDLSYGLQKTLLRVLQEKKFRPLSSKREVTSDFRLIAATNRHLDAMLPTSEFRQDLYYRIKTIHLRLPPLRERPEDLEELANYYIEKICDSLDTVPKQMCPEFMDALRRYNWPGNVRELINALYSGVNNSLNEETLGPHHLPLELRSFLAKQRLGSNGDSPAASAETDMGFYDGGTLLKMKDVRKRTIDSMERAYLEHLSLCSEGSIAQACRISGLSRARLYELLQKHEINLRENGGD
jgi:two-component system NtrC family response regulator